MLSLPALIQVGTYSCHGVEPSYSGGGDDDEGVTAKINQDRGCVVYPFNGDAKHALFSVFDGGWATAGRTAGEKRHEILGGRDKMVVGGWGKRSSAYTHYVGSESHHDTETERFVVGIVLP